MISRNLLQRISHKINADMIENHRGDLNEIAKQCASSFLYEEERLSLKRYLDTILVANIDENQIFEQWKNPTPTLVFQNSKSLIYFLYSVRKELDNPAYMQGKPPSWYKMV
jgi:hypothetical protein